MDTDLVLDLFRHTTVEDDGRSTRKDLDQQSTASPHKNILSGLEDLPTEEEYQDLDLSSYMASISR
jgi:TATA-binding protein-associated factor